MMSQDWKLMDDYDLKYRPRQDIVPVRRGRGILCFGPFVHGSLSTRTGQEMGYTYVTGAHDAMCVRDTSYGMEDRDACHECNVALYIRVLHILACAAARGNQRAAQALSLAQARKLDNVFKLTMFAIGYEGRHPEPLNDSRDCMELRAQLSGSLYAVSHKTGKQFLVLNR
jgi:hypothetical protein